VKPRGKRSSRVLPGIIAVAVFLVLLRILFGGRPSDSRLVKQFNRTRPVFLELKAMIATNSPADPLREVNSVWSMEHYRNYRTLLRKAKLMRVFRDGPELRFQVAGAEMGKKGYRIAVTWTEGKPKPLIGSIDEFRKGSKQPEHAYRSLGDGWYLWMEE